jgi:hypothetical protein
MRTRAPREYARATAQPRHGEHPGAAAHDEARRHGGATTAASLPRCLVAQSSERRAES